MTEETLTHSPVQDDPMFQALSERVANQSELLMSVILDLERNSKATDEINIKVDKLGNDTGELVSAFKSAKGAFEVLEWAGKVSKILLPVFLACGSLAYAGEWMWAKVKLALGVH